MSRVLAIIPLLLALAAACRAGIETIDSIQVSPALPSPDDEIAVRVVGTEGGSCPVTFLAPLVDGNTVRIRTGDGAVIECPGNPPLVHVDSIGRLPAGAYRILVEQFGLVRGSSSFVVRPAAQSLSLRGSRFSLSLRWWQPAGPDGTATAVALTDESGYFWFFSPTNMEVTVKLLDGGAVNGHTWLFLSGLTDRSFELTVEDVVCPGTTTPCPASRTYSSPAGAVRNIIDLEAFVD